MNRILVVDDNAANLYLLRSLLEGNGFVSEEAANGSEALERAQRNPPDLVISDLLMPVMDGFTLLKRWKADPRLRSIHFMVYTATYTDARDERFALDLGADAFLIKPSEPEALLERIREVLARKDKGTPPAIPKSDPGGARLGETHAEILYEKLEKRAAQLESTNLELRKEIAERERAEEDVRANQERFRELAESIQEVFWMTAANGDRFLYVNPAYEKIWGRTCESLLGDPDSWRASIHPDDQPRVRAIPDAAAAARGPYDETYRILRPDGILRWVRVRAYPVQEADGRMAHIVGTAEDITERRALEERIRQTQKLESIGQLAAGVAHDFNNILAVIGGNVELAMGKAGGNPAVSGYLNEVEKATERARNLVRQILSFSRQQPLERHVLALGPVVRETVDFLRAVVPRRIEFTLSVPGGDPPVLADATQIHQVVSNLVINSMHALEGRRGSIAISLEGLDLDAATAARLSGIKPGKFARLCVSDNGNGMDERTLARIFDPFFTTKAPGFGTGLGLAVALGIVQGHDGAIEVSSRPGEGTVFRIYFPAAATLAATPGAKAGVPAAAGRHVLLLDDEMAQVALAKRMLESAGCRVDAFCDPAEAIRSFRSPSAGFDLVIVDSEMPGINGLEVAEEMHRLQPGMPILLYSGHLGPDLRERAAVAGIREILHKPTTLEEYIEAIRRCPALR
jgi:two-component system cell cycle sensor histidine kinase/response regulator CckA